MKEQKLRTHIEEGFSDLESRKGRLRAFGVICKNEGIMAARYPALADRVRRVKEHATDNVEQLLDQTVRKLEENGCHVYLASTAEDALRYILRLVKPGSLVVKSKSNVSKEIGVVHALEEIGCRVVETDLGDRINQLAKSKPSHTMAPAIHIPREKVAEIFSKELGRQLDADIPTLVTTAREALRGDLIRADVGISGANAIAAETGTIFVEENEGNIRAVTNLPPLHIAVAGINKIVATPEDALAILRGAAVWGVGQDIGTYVSAISGPARTYTRLADGPVAGGQGAQEMHVILLDNGRRQAIAEGFGEAFYCINCGSCLNFCPIYREIGDSYGAKYIGGIGVLQTAFMQGLDKAVEAGLDLCLGCRMCQKHCPNQINTPDLMAKLRAKVIEKDGMNLADRAILDVGLKHISKVAPVARAGQTLVLKGEEEGAHPRFSVAGLEQRRLVPRFANEGLGKAMRDLPRVENPQKRVAFFPGCFMDYIYTDVGKSVIRVLQRNQVEVLLPEGRVCCGMPHYMKGDHDTARQLAERNVALLTGMDVDAVVVACGTCGSAFKHGYPSLYYQEPFGPGVFELSRKVYDISEFLTDVIQLDGGLKSLPQSVTYHDPCHLSRWMGVTEQPRQLLKSVPGLEFREMEEPDICCGAGGTFCFHFYDFSLKVNERKMEQLQQTGAGVLATSCPACIMHLRDGIHQKGMSQKVVHLAQLLDQAYGI